MTRLRVFFCGAPLAENVIAAEEVIACAIS